MRFRCVGADIVDPSSGKISPDARRDLIPVRGPWPELFKFKSDYANQFQVAGFQRVSKQLLQELEGVEQMTANIAQP